MMDLMDDCGMRGTVCLNGEIIREYPRIIEEGEKRNWAGSATASTTHPPTSSVT